MSRPAYLSPTLAAFVKLARRYAELYPGDRAMLRGAIEGEEIDGYGRHVALRVLAFTRDVGDLLGLDDTDPAIAALLAAAEARMSWLDDLEDKWRSAPDKWGHATGRLYVAGQDGEPIRGVMQVGMWPSRHYLREAIADWICAMQNAMPRLLRIARLAEGGRILHQTAEA